MNDNEQSDITVATTYGRDELAQHWVMMSDYIKLQQQLAECKVDLSSAINSLDDGGKYMDYAHNIRSKWGLYE